MTITIFAVEIKIAGLAENEKVHYNNIFAKWKMWILTKKLNF